MLYSVVNNHTISAIGLNHDLKVISQWTYQWKMKFNPDLNKQATELLFSCKKNSTNHPSLFFNGSVVPKEQKHLGLTLDSKLSFERHVNERIIKVLESLNISRNIYPLKLLIKCIKLCSVLIWTFVFFFSLRIFLLEQKLHMAWQQNLAKAMASPRKLHDTSKNK